jgi:bifunctional DNA-binding transcriptional regulator/antitoxin component of YhaV-PrlF toxin-antitoxin module
MKVVPDKTHRIVITRDMRNALNLKPGESLEISINPGAVILTPSKKEKGKLTRKGKMLVYTGDIPDVDIVEAVNRARR